ncbi:MAG TPA: hypothetical protein VFC96_06530 [Anaerovoracaceae bacterium]|nr:hypothetical protein [Anaerovoracaceae bacterium]
MMNKKDDAIKEFIASEIRNFVRKYMERSDISTKWGIPLVGFANAKHPYIRDLKKIVGDAHEMPEDVLPDAKIVIAYYLPFTKELNRMNSEAGRHAASQWAIAYEETNAIFDCLSEHLIGFLKAKGYNAAVSKATKTFDRNLLKSNWSHRHFAYAAGLGTFGVNNMLISKVGCSGRYFTLVTNLEVSPDEPMKSEMCLHKRNGKCLVCVKKCPVGALGNGGRNGYDGYDRHLCYSMISENAKIHKGYGSSYSNEENIDCTLGTEVCGKCITSSPCATWKG